MSMDSPCIATATLQRTPAGKGISAMNLSMERQIASSCGCDLVRGHKLTEKLWLIR
jgi:hypothetical protein